MLSEHVLDFVPAPVLAKIAGSPGGRTFPVRNPATGGVIAQTADANAADARRTADLTAETFTTWKTTTAFERSAIMRRWFNLMMEHVNTIARLMTLEMGKPITESVGEVKYAAGF